VAKDKGKRRLTQSRSAAGFKPFTLERRSDDDLPPHIKGVAVWKEIKDKEGYWVFDILSTAYLAVEYEEATRQWYFIQQDSRTNNWVAVDTVPSTYGLGRPVHPITTVAVDTDDTEATSGQYQSSYFKPGNIQSSAMTTVVQSQQQWQLLRWPTHQRHLDWHRTSSAEDPAVDHLEDQAEDHPEEEPLHLYPLAAVAVEAEAAAAEVEAQASHPLSHQVLLEEN
jgi:hypothetical protein